jgi:tRNA uridine 5-carboxymethylaminomethyl modification enzyme
MNRYDGDFDCIVIGGGHAGIEAGNASAKLGAKTALLTISRDTIGKMSCNPAIGGLAKGQLAREVDAMGGLMGLAIDKSGIQFRILNKSKGAAVRSPRAQADKYEYVKVMQQLIEEVSNLEVIEGLACDINTEKGRVSSVSCKDGRILKAKKVVLTAGTFLRGLMHIGEEKIEGGRLNEPASNELSESLERAGLKLGRLKTGTPVRLKAETINYDRLEIQNGDKVPVPFSFLNDKIDSEQIPCWITYTNEKIHKLISDNLSRAPLYTGQIKSVGPRYCPSIESKIIRFRDKTRHQVFLEPEDREVTSIYANGISTSLPKDVQHRMLELLPGTEKAEIIHYAYAIEYDYCPPNQLKPSLETHKVNGLYLAGQVNGTSGYEEAAGQGLIAGVNAARAVDNKEPVILTRDQAYIGVLIDDLLTKDIEEPYRMFTSRAEYRLALRADNADRRLTPLAKQMGLVSDDRWGKYQQKIEGINKLKTYLKNTRKHGKSLWKYLQTPESGFADELADIEFVKKSNITAEQTEAVIIDAKYEGYLKKQRKAVENFKRLESLRIPENLQYDEIEHLKIEAKARLKKFRPSTLGKASRISGVTPADINVLQIYMKKLQHGGKR